MVRLHGYQRPPRGGRGRCRRVCERTHLRGRRRRAPLGLLIGRRVTARRFRAYGGEVGLPVIAASMRYRFGSSLESKVTDSALFSVPIFCSVVVKAVRSWGVELSPSCWFWKLVSG
jgi:hypothetical protein